MALESNAKLLSWSRVFVRHAKEKFQLDLYEIDRRVKKLFRTHSGSIGMLGNRPPSGKWLIGLKVPTQAWISMFSNAADGDQLFKAVAKSTCLEAVFVGYDPAKRGWFVQYNREGKESLNFALPPKYGDQLDKAKFKATDIDASVLEGCSSGKDAVDRICRHLKVNPAEGQLDYSQGCFQALSIDGKPLPPEKVGCFEHNGYEIIKGEHPASDMLKNAIERRDAKAIREAVAQGARLDALPDTTSSPLLAAFFECCKPGGKDCVAALVELGCPIDGRPQDDPTVFDCVHHFLNESLSLEMLKMLVSLGGNVKAADRDGQTALFTPVVYRRMGVVHFLLAQGVNPTAKDHKGKSVVDWLQERLKSGCNTDAERQDYAKILSMCTGEPLEGVCPADEALPPEQSAVVRQQIAKCVGINASQVVPQATFFDDLGGRSEHLELLSLGIEQALGVSLQPVVDGINVRTAIDEKGNVGFDSLKLIQTYLSKWTAPFAPTPFRSLFTVSMIEAMVAKAFEENAEKPMVHALLSPEHTATVRKMIAEEAHIPATELNPQTNLIRDLQLNPIVLGFLLIQIKIKLDVDYPPLLKELQGEFQVDQQGRLTDSSARRLRRILPGYAFDTVTAKSFDDLFTVGMIEAAIAKTLAERPADLPFGGIDSDEQQAWVQQLPEQLGERKLRHLLAGACRFAFEPQGTLDPGVEEAIAALEHFAETGESKKTLRDLRRKFWQEWRVDRNPSYRALHEAINPNDPLPAVPLVTRAIAEAHKLSEQEAVREIRRLHKSVLSLD